MSDTLLDLIGREVAELLAPLTSVADDPDRFDRLMYAIGAEPPDSMREQLLTALTTAAALKAQLDDLLAEPAPSLDTLTRVIDISRRAFATVRAIDSIAGSSAALTGLGSDLAAMLLTSYLRHEHPLFRSIAVLLTFIEPAEEHPPRDWVVVDGQVVRGQFATDRLRFDRLASLLRNPAARLREEYTNPLTTTDDANAIAEKLFPRLQQVLDQFGISSRYGLNPDEQAVVGEAAPFLDHALIIYFDDMLLDAETESGVVLTISAADRGDLGLVISPFGTITSIRELAAWRLSLSVTAGVDVIAYGRHGLTLLVDDANVTANASMTATLPAPQSGPAFVLGSPNGSRLEVGGAEFKVTATLQQSDPTLALSADVTRSALVIAAGDGDGFISSILPADGLRAEFDLGLAWSNTTGLTLRGSANLEADMPVGLSVAGVSLPSVHLGLRANEGGLTAEVSASIVTSLGPVRAIVDRIGIELALDNSPNSGSLGLADLHIGFKPPSGIGLTVEARGVITGGGMLFHDPARQLYAGVMQLSLHELITLKGFGLIGTRMPDGSAGFSLIIFITAEDFRPIPLGFGFFLLGIGGMVAVNRSFNVEVLRQGLKSGTLATLLFPRDPVGNAPTLIQTLANAFPARRGSYLLGILAKIGWFTPTLVTLDLALILEFGARQRLLALGRVRALLPSADNDLVRLNMETLGVIDFDEGTVALDAVLLDSRLVHRFPISGSSALRARFGSGRGSSFLLAAGGFNPRFGPPAGFPKLDRLTIALSAGDNPRLICEAYFAITANTVQFGARASLYAAAAGFKLVGDIGFDVLLQRAPLHFIANYHARLQLKRGSHNLFMVEVEGELQGPRPLRVSGKARFKIFWVRFSVRFDATLVRGEPPPLPPAVNVFQELVNALNQPTSWSVRHSADHTYGVALRSLPTGSGEALVLDPLGQLVVQQQIVPLGTGRDIDTFGGAPVTGARRFTLSAALGGTTLPQESLQAAFAPAQFFVMSDDQKLTAPSFETMDAGCVFGSTDIQFDETKVVAAPLGYRTIVITPRTSQVNLNEPAAKTTPPSYTLTNDQLKRFRRSGAAARATVRRSGRARFHNGAASPGATFKPNRWTILPTNGGAPLLDIPPDVRTWSDYQAVLATLNRGGARWQLLPTHELET